MIPVIKMECTKCGREFPVSPAHFAELGFKNLPKRCPTCIDMAQNRPSVVQERKLIRVYDGVEIINLPTTWQEVATGEKDVPSYNISVKGSRFGASWSGRIDVFANKPFSFGDIISVREMVSSHKIKVVHGEKATMKYGTVPVEKELPITSEEGEEVIRSRRYLVFEPYDGPATSRLVWVTAHTKTFGRQYWAKVVGSPIAQWIVSGGVRSGRARTVGVLAIVDENHPLFVKGTGDIQFEDTYN